MIPDGKLEDAPTLTLQRKFTLEVKPLKEGK